MIRKRTAQWAFLILVVIGIVWVAYLLRTVVNPLLLGLGIAYILSPAMAALERRRVPRPLAAGGFVGGTFLLVAALLVLGAVFLAKESSTFYGKRKDYIEKLSAALVTVDEAVEDATDLLRGRKKTGDEAESQEPSEEEKDAGERFRQRALELIEASGLEAKDAATVLSRTLDWLVSAVTAGISGLTGLALLIVLLPLYTYCFLVDLPRIRAAVHRNLPHAVRDRVVDLARRCDHILAEFFRGRLLVALIIAAIAAPAFALLGVPFGFLLGILTGLSCIVPFAPVVVFLPVLALTWLDKGLGWNLLAVVAVFGMIQGLEGFVVTPRVVGKGLGLHIVTATVALIAFGQLLGFMGVLLALPLAAMIKVLGAEFVMPVVRRLAAPPAEEEEAGDAGDDESEGAQAEASSEDEAAGAGGRKGAKTSRRKSTRRSTGRRPSRRKKKPTD